MCLDIGSRIRELRIAKNLTLEELADRCELTKGFLSQLENNVNTPSIVTLQDITEVLGISMSDFFKEEDNKQIIFGKNDYFIDEKELMQRVWLVPNAQENEMEPILLKLDCNGQSLPIESHEGQEFGYVLKGKVSLVFDDVSYDLKKGETFYLHGKKAHYLENRNNEQCQVIWVCTPPIF